MMVALFGRAKAAPANTHGLVGRYYVSGPQVAVKPNDFLLPEPVTAPAATRVDAQIAFGQGSGFKNPPTGRHGAAWSPTGSELFGAAMWDGFIHLPKAGTYYFATVSQGPSAVYLNQARVALNGRASVYGRLLWTENFAYDPADVQDFIQNVKGTPNGLRQDAYSLPVTVDGPRDLPLRVRYNGQENGFIGIDLMWVTPDSPKDPNGKPIMKIVPSDVLYTDAPGPIAPTVVRGANSTVTSDLNCSGLRETKPITLTFRLADKNGNPVAGKHVVFTTLSDDDFGFNELGQPDKATDENGVTTATLKSKPDARAHTSTIYATDVTDLVDVAQVGHVRFPDVKPAFFASPCTSGFDPNLITVEPLPMMVGRPVTISVKLQNRQKIAVDLKATFQATDWNIGANTWKDIGEVDKIELNPGDVRDVSMKWTPTAEQIHQCFKVRLSGKPKNASRNISGAGVMAAAVPSLALLQDDQEKSDVYRILNHEPDSTAQRNLSGVSGCDPKIMILYTLSGHGVAKFCFQPPPDAGQMSARRPPNLPPLKQEPTAGKGASSNPNTNPAGGSTTTGGTTPPTGDGQGGSEPPSSGPSAKTAATNLGATVAYRYKVLCDQFAGHLLAAPSQPAQSSSSSSWAHWLKAYRECQNERTAWTHLSQDPPAQHYRGLAVAQSDTAPAYVAAAQTSMERYRAAQANSDAEWTARQLKAMQLYLKRAADAERSAGNEDQKQSELAPPDDKDLSAAQGALNDWTTQARKGGVPVGDLAKLQSQGMSPEEAKSFVADLASYDQPIQLKDARSTLTDSAALRRSTADQADQIAALSPDQGLAGESFVQTYQVVNPHDKEETVDLFIHPLAMSPMWKVYIANVADPSQLSGNANPQPKYPVREVQEGDHYSVTLPAKAQVQLASVLVPGGDVGANTVARWAVEGRIGGDVIGTMVHEMTVPHIVADLTLPPVGSQEQFDEGPMPASSGQSHIPVTLIVATVIGIVFVLFVIFFWRRRRRADASQ
ncbi:MAG TPA: Ig-like domain-containing protein [Terriglobales bacterium]|nr:Ig-like domain-containing protein [Terriglobales bacterium]